MIAMAAATQPARVVLAVVAQLQQKQIVQQPAGRTAVTVRRVLAVHVAGVVARLGTLQIACVHALKMLCTPTGLVMATAMALPKSGVLTYVARILMVETAPKQSALKVEILLQMVLHLLKMQ